MRRLQSDRRGDGNGGGGGGGVKLYEVKKKQAISLTVSNALTVALHDASFSCSSAS